MNNRMHNASNPNQGDSKKVLCVCSAGLLRSPTTAIVLNKEYGYNTRSAGIDTGHALIPVDEVLIHWSDEIVCMDTNQRDLIFSMFDKYKQESCEIVVLDIPDNFGYMDTTLQEIILQRYSESLEN